jgi:hypothetical protein
MADIPLFPTEENVKTYRDFVNVQKEYNDYLLREKSLYKEIGRISLDVQQRVNDRRKQEQRMLLLNREKMLEINELVRQRATATGAQLEKLNRSISATQDQIKYNKDLLNIIRETNDIEITMAKKKYEDDRKWGNFAKGQMENILGLKVKEYDMMKNVGDKLVEMEVATEGVAYAWGAVLAMLKGFYDLFKRMDKAAWDFRKAMGMTRPEAQVIRNNAQRIAIDLMHVGVTIEGAYKSFQELGRLMGGVHNVTKGMAENVSIMSAQLGISEETSARFMRNMAAISKNTMESQTNAMYIAQSMSSAAGVPLADVMNDVASKSSTTLTMMSRYPNLALKSAIELRRMGTSLDQASKSSRHILDFTENVNEEMEASVLLGRSINLQRARELAYRRDLEGSQKEILRITKSINFEKLDVFQQEAYARATGKSVDELLNMLQADREIAKVRRAGTPEQKKQLKAYEDMKKANEATLKAQGKNVENTLRQKANQERIVAIQNKWNQILAKAQEFLLPIIDGLLAAVIPVMDIARGIFAWTGAIKLFMSPILKIAEILHNRITLSLMVAARYGKNTLTVFEKIFYVIGRMGQAMSRFINFVKGGFGFFKEVTRVAMVAARYGTAGLSRIEKVFLFFGKIGSFFGKIFAPIGKLFGFFGKFAGFLGLFTKWIPILGWVITAFQFIGNLFKRLHGIGEAFKGGILNGIWFGIKAIGGALYDTLIQPFVDAWNWIKGIFVGKSPSKLAMGIFNGIKSVASMLFNVLTLPYRMAWSFIIKGAQFAGKMVWKAITGYFNMWKQIGTLVFNGAKYLGEVLWKGVKSVAGGAFWKMLSTPFKIIGKAIERFTAKPVETRAQAAYVSAATFTPKSSELATAPGKSQAKNKDTKEESKPMSEETGQKIAALLQKILEKDTNVHMDGQLLSTQLARQTEYRGGYGVNKVA